MSEVILDIKNVSKSFFGVRALDKVSFNLLKGEVHALIGENGAGKSTLMKILLGEQPGDSGEIYYKGKLVSFKAPIEALRSGISMIHQETCLISSMSVSENIWLGREELFTRAGIIDRKSQVEATEKLLREYEINVDPQKKIQELNIAMLQLVELARALSFNSEIIVMDEPTSSLTESEIKLLYKIIRRISANGVSVIFISHKLEEIFEICQRVTVFRDGKYISTDRVEDITQEDLVKKIVGRDLSEMFVRSGCKKGDVVLEVKNLNSPAFSDINFSVRAGEVVGFFGLLGAGRTEVMRSIFGIDRFTSGEVLLRGEQVNIRQPKDALKQGIGMITEDRLRMGAIYKLSVMANATLSNFDKVCNKLGMFNSDKEREMFLPAAENLKIKYSSPNEYIDKLSGGNQQKVIIGRWLLTEPKVLIMDEPTRGIDVGAKMEIYRIIENLAAQGVAIILVTSEMAELLSLSDRIMVMREGRIVHSCEGKDATQETIISHAFGVE